MLSRLKGLFRPQADTARLSLDAGQFAQALARFPALHRLDRQDQSLLMQRSLELLQTKAFLGAEGFEPADEDCFAVAVLAGLPVLHLGLTWYRDFHTFILYPGEFLADIEEVDEDGLVHSGHDLRSGEAWARGPVVLSMPDVWASGQGEGYNVVVHELAHQIDQRNGEANGFPPLPPTMDPAEWTRAFSTGYARLLDELARGREPGIDPYGAESPAEFFAVACEFFFDAPDWLAAHQPAVFAQLNQFFRTA